jgi:peptidyl-prolyl cis-trans isomerase SurA
VIEVPTSGGQFIDRIVAIVNDDIITLSELEFMIEPYIDQIKSRNYPPDREKQMMFKVREDFLNQLINQKLTDQQIAKANIQVSDLEIDEMIERLKESRFLTEEELRAELLKQGLTLEEYRKRMKEQALRHRLVNFEIKSKIVITEEDIREYYDSQPEIFGGEVSYHLRNIILTVPIGSDKERVREQMGGIIEKLKQGESFESLAKQYSQSPLAKTGGDLGTFKMTSLSPQIKTAIKDLDEGEYTAILDTDQGFQIFYVQEILRTGGKTFEEVSEDIGEKLYNDIVNRRFESWLKDLRKQSHIKIIK